MPVEKRNSTDRRQSDAVPRFPLRDSDARRVSQDRRGRPDRHLAAGIEVEWLEMKHAGGYPK